MAEITVTRKIQVPDEVAAKFTELARIGEQFSTMVATRDGAIVDCYAAKVPTRMIADALGLTTSQVLRLYRKATGTEAAKREPQKAK